jgi:hypothetical protein
MWLNPLPAETVLAAIIGAVLGTVLGKYGYFDISNWLDSRYALEFTFLIVSFGVACHFYCAACLLDKALIRRIFLLLAFVVFIVVLFYSPKVLTVSPDGTLSWLPNEGNALLGGVLLIWIFALRALTAIKKLSGE